MTTSLKKRPWLKFFPADWRADPRLRMCSLAARGLWIDLIAYMHEGEPYGHLTIDGKAPDLSGIAALVARPTAEVKKALRELEEKHVTARTDEGVIYSRRMVRDFAKALRDHENGKEGGNPNLPRMDKEGVNPPDKAQKPEARNQEARNQKAGETRTREGEKLPEDWKPSDAVLAKAKAAGLTGEDIAKAVAKFAGNHRSKGTLRVDWDAAFEVWCINDAEKLGRTPPSAETPAAKPKVHVKADTPQWEAWCKYLGKAHHAHDRNFGWYFDAEWPPGYEPQQAALAEDIWDEAITAFKASGNWPRWAKGSEPGIAGCLVPADILRKHGFDTNLPRRPENAPSPVGESIESREEADDVPAPGRITAIFSGRGANLGAVSASQRGPSAGQKIIDILGGKPCVPYPTQSPSNQSEA